MKLGEYLAAKGLTQQQFGDQIGADRSLVSRWINGLVLPTAPYIEKIESATKRKVGFADFDWERNGK